MKVVICSLPGSEVYLLSNFLFELNLKSSSYVVDNDSFHFSNNVNALDKSHFEVDKAIGQINDNEFLIGHFGVDVNKNIGEFKRIFLYRNIKFSLISFCFLVDKLKIWKSNKALENNDSNEKEYAFNFLQQNKDSLVNLYSKIVPWINEEGILKINFDELNGEFGREIQIKEFKKIAQYLNFDLSDLDIELKISNALNKSSIFKVNFDNQEDYYLTKDFLKLYKKGFKKLNKILGYERTSDILKKFKLTNSLSFYDKYWKLNKRKVSTWSYGINIVDNLISNYDFKNVLDAGCGSGDVVRHLLSKGYNARGIELSGSVLKDFANDLLKKGIVQQGSLMKLPFKDDEFDVIFSSEVLEHIDEKDIPKVIEEFSRVCSGVVFLTISLRPSSNFNKYHINLKPRVWWENVFLQHSFVKDTDTIKKLQKIKLNSTVKEIMEIGPTFSHIHEMDWFVNNPPYDLDGELEPWYFIFRKNAK
ncbi:class I SAM-dependent methyltransferase [Flavobacterium sharifuzzamanii]|uniref:class I SAM-dependent methyltransferase n=1 Tax=Flavobacterium sharifuzzamanii TaxID=2211133 RepID=UPI000DAF1720|nr:class I SAM-dependent methyltransferase [Flavobacterium sharifuzzamanii]KAF2081170.1 class I SAM-dependent methyltransferase [Flavobacterium sharifuzzamanii]